MPWKSKEKERGDNTGDGFNDDPKEKDLPRKTHEHQKGKWKSAAHLGEHMGKMNDTGHE